MSEITPHYMQPTASSLAKQQPKFQPQVTVPPPIVSAKPVARSSGPPPHVVAQIKLQQAMRLVDTQDKVAAIEKLRTTPGEVGLQACQLLLRKVNEGKPSLLHQTLSTMMQMTPAALEREIRSMTTFQQVYDTIENPDLRRKMVAFLPTMNQIENTLGRSLNSNDMVYIQRALAKNAPAGLIKHVLGAGDYHDDFAASMGRHPAWMRTEAMGRFVTGMDLSDKAQTMLSLNQAKEDGQITGDSLLYLGSGGDILHPLFTTSATTLDLVTLAMHGPADSVERSLQELAADGYEVVRDNSGAPPTTSFTVRSAANHDEVALQLNLHHQGYDAYFAAHPETRHDIVFDKDSWLSEWRPDSSELIASITGRLSEHGMWIGGFESGRQETAALLEHTFTDHTADIVTEGQGTWSGYEKVQVCTFRNIDVREAIDAIRVEGPQDETGRKVMAMTEGILGNYLTRGILEQANYTRIRDDDIGGFAGLSEYNPGPEHVRLAAQYVHARLDPRVNLTVDQVAEHIQHAIDTYA